ncbi:hypothetical protein AJGP001_16835 [Planococcus faecalis]|uniref:Opine dehydrogenase n=1 Tax=Planococcus faecalis TaxID=1598147 RepID=A0ABM6IWU5_9BACL|nr:NAD/NADP octopine/nopaline dehydrogenase family protein [Planococcus faecalis]AQU80852.1 hypothetical protein AJGP001_16835 [Planococcus faecalis]
MKIEKIAILGAGNGGITAAADLKSKGFQINLYEMPQFKNNLEGIIEKGGITLKDDNGENFFPIDLVTTDIAEAVKDAELVMMTVPGFAIEQFAELLAPVVKESQFILINGAGAMGCMRFVSQARKVGVETAFKIAETNSLTYGTRAFPNEARVELSLRVKKLFLAAYPKEDTELILNVCSQVYDCFVAADNIWHTTLENGNPEVHPGPSLLNAGRIDFSEGEFWLYKEGITEHTVKVIKGIERERMEIGEAFGFTLENAVQSRARRGYFSNENEDLQTLFNTSEVFSKIKGPVSVNSRYFTEDISSGLVLWSDLGKVAKVATPTIDSVINLGGTILERDFFEEGLTLKKLGLDNLPLEKLIDLV